jgi:CHAT domain-containing protein
VDVLIDEDEAGGHLERIERALAAETPEVRTAALIDGLLTYGHRFGYSLRHMVEISGGDERFQALDTEFEELMTRWLGLEELTDRADEAQRRAAAAVAMAEQLPRLGVLAARCVLALPDGDPQRDVAVVRRLLEAYAAAAGESDGAEAELSVLTQMLELDEPPEAELDERVRRGLALEAEVGDPQPRRRFRLNAVQQYLRLAIAARDGDDAAGQRRLAERAIDLLQTFPSDPGLLTTLAAAFAVLDDGEQAAEAFRRALEDPDASPRTQLLAAWHEARTRAASGDHVRVIEVLQPRLADYERQYLTAVADEDVADAGRTFGEVVINLAFAHAQLDDWASALAVLDRGKSRRARYRAALRATLEGAEILERERELYALARGATQRPPVVPEFHVDPLAAGVTPQASLLEAYRSLRPRLELDALATPSLTDVAAVLRPDEAALLLGFKWDLTLVAAVRNGDTAAPRIARRIRIGGDRWASVFAPQDDYGWLTALAAGLDRDACAAALRPLLGLCDELLGDIAEELYTDGVRRLVIVPHRVLHLVPFWAAPSLRRFVVETAPSAAALVGARGDARAPALGASALLVVNPTGDLPVAAAEADAVEQRLAGRGLRTCRQARAAATETAVVTALREQPDVVHFCGHGRSDPLQPERSALLLHPEPELLDGTADPFAAWSAAVDTWEEGEDTRSGEVPGVGRLIEAFTDAGFERRLEYGEQGTLWSLYDGDRPVALSELWTAGDMLVGRELDGCSLVVLSACESGAGGLGVDELDEATGLPAAMQLAGAANIVATLWPVGDAHGAVFVDELYAELASSSGTVDLAEVVHSVRAQLRTLPRAAVLERVAALRARTSDAVARFALERFARDVRAGGERPFEDPYEWAPFFVLGRSQLTIAEVT